MNHLFKNTKLLFAILISVLYFFASLLTLSDYGINWDSASHLLRGQAFLHYYITGRVDYSNLKNWNLYKEKEKEIKEKTAQDAIPRNRLYFQKVKTIFFSPDIPNDQVPRVSIYQLSNNGLQDIEERYEYGHPHISDVIASFFNYILFQKLGILNDIDSYRVYGILLASALVGLVFYWTAVLYGKFSGIVASLSLSLYPLFWAESHFNNEKDIPETVFWSFMLFSVWQGIRLKSWRWVLVSGLFFGLALGTKFNILFSVFVVLPWLICLISMSKEKFALVFTKKYIKTSFALIAAPFLGIIVVIGTWPAFWSDPVHKISRIIDFYKDIGTNPVIDPKFIGPLEANTYAIQWIFYTTPLVIVSFAVVGLLMCAIKIIKKRDTNSLFLLLWLMVPIARVTWPGTNIYGGVRQIMEFIPAMAIIAGIGAVHIVKWLNSRTVKLKPLSNLAIQPFQFCIILLLIPVSLKLVEIHPNENVYFNSLIGGLAGARERDFPSWGVSFGAPYREAIDWVNNNAEPGAKLTLTEVLSNIPGIFIRPDINYGDKYRSGYLRQGEYVISLKFDGVDKRSYLDMYLERMVKPVYKIKVDEVTILKIWKNDNEHLNNQWEKEETLVNVQTVKEDSGLLFDLKKNVKLSRLELDYQEDANCSELSSGYLMISKDNINWERVPGVLPEEVRIDVLGKQPKNGKLIEPFAGQKARYVNILLSPPDACLRNVERVKFYHFDI